MINLDKKTVDDLPFTEKLLFGDTQYNTVRSLAEAFAFKPEPSIDIIADRLIITTTNKDIEKSMIKDMSLNNISNKPFFNIYTFETNMTKICWAYKSKDYNSSRFKVYGENQKNYILYSQKI
jgi:hypothetical protein